MDRVVAFWLVERQLMAAPIELVAAILQPIGPWDQHLPPRGGAHLVDPVAVEKRPATGGVRTKPAADLDDYRPLILDCNLDLLAGGCNHGAPHASSATPARVGRRGASGPNLVSSGIARTPHRGRSFAPWPQSAPDARTPVENFLGVAPSTDRILRRRGQAARQFATDAP